MQYSVDSVHHSVKLRGEKTVEKRTVGKNLWAKLRLQTKLMPAVTVHVFRVLTVRERMENIAH